MGVRSLSWEDPLEKGMAAHSSILAWRIPQTEEPGMLQYIGSQTQTHTRPPGKLLAWPGHGRGGPHGFVGQAVSSISTGAIPDGDARKPL